MALIIEVQQIGDIFRVVSHQIAESDNNPDFEALQRIVDENAAEAPRLIEVRDTIKALLQQMPLEQRESEVISLFCKGLTFPKSLNASAFRVSSFKRLFAERLGNFAKLLKRWVSANLKRRATTWTTSFAFVVAPMYW